MKKLMILFILAVMFVIMVSPVNAMIDGELDFEHTNVGAIVMEWPAYDYILARLCSATLIYPRVLVTAAHCYSGLVDLGWENEPLWVTFNQDALAEDAVYLDVADFIPHPKFNSNSRDHDIALIILEDPVPELMGISPEPLPEQGYLNDLLLGLKGKEEREVKLTIVGFGAPALLPLPDRFLDAERRYGTVTYQNLLPLEILINNSGENDAAICHGDSGGPVFYNDVLVGLHSSRIRTPPCSDEPGLTLKYRLDTASAQDFINANLP